ncbi:unnamed protein product [Camellia sinensis]
MGAKCDSSTTFPLFAFRKFITPRRKISFLIVNKAESSFSNVKRANLAARKKDRVKLPNYNDGGGGKRIYHISEFLSHPSGIEAILNTSALQTFQFLDANLYRCTLPRVQLLNFEVAPVLDLRVTTTDEDCTVEMLSCKFVGSEVLERQNEHFSASMRNRITWDPNDTEPFLDVDVKLNLTLEGCKLYWTGLYHYSCNNYYKIIENGFNNRVDTCNEIGPKYCYCGLYLLRFVSFVMSKLSRLGAQNDLEAGISDIASILGKAMYIMSLVQRKVDAPSPS